MRSCGLPGSRIALFCAIFLCLLSLHYIRSVCLLFQLFSVVSVPVILRSIHTTNNNDNFDSSYHSVLRLVSALLCVAQSALGFIVKINYTTP